MKGRMNSNLIVVWSIQNVTGDKHNTAHGQGQGGHKFKKRSAAHPYVLRLPFATFALATGCRIRHLEMARMEIPTNSGLVLIVELTEVDISIEKDRTNIVPLQVCFRCYIHAAIRKDNDTKVMRSKFASKSSTF